MPDIEMIFKRQQLSLYLIKHYNNSVALVHKRTTTTERPPPVGEASANLCGQRDVARSAWQIPMAIILDF
jgi:hypothetical protein